MNKAVYLTVDDAPSKDFARKLEFLQSKQIPAIIFCIGQQIPGNEAALLDAIKSGYLLGNHSFTHAHFSTLSIGQIESEILQTDELIEQLYTQAGTKRPMKVFRFPYGDYAPMQTEKVQALLRTSGYRMPELTGIDYSFYKQHLNAKRLDVPWTFNIMEYRLKELESIKKRLIASKWPLGIEVDQNGGYLTSGSAEIILIHDHADTTPVFTAIIDELLTLGVQFRKIPTK